MYILSVKINMPRVIKTKPEIFEEYFWNVMNNLLFILNLPAKTDMSIKGIVRPIEKLTSNPIPLLSVSEFEVRVKRAPNTGPMHGVKPNAKVRPRTKFLNVENFFKST